MSSLFACWLILAQIESPPGDPPAPVPAPAPTDAPAPAPEASGEPTPAPTLEETAAKLTALEEQTATNSNDILSLKNLKISGYVQPRISYSEASKQGLDDKGSAAIKDGFSVRRARLKTVYATPRAAFVLQIDATTKGVLLKEAEARLFEPWTGKNLAFAIGQTAWPFGYEAPLSSSELDLPERSRVVRAFLPNEYDRGAKVVANVGILRAQVGAFDGNGIDNKAFIGVDNDKHKDAIGRVGLDLDTVVFGVSGWYGRTFMPGDPTASPGIKGETFDRRRIGADVQLYLDLLPIGGTKILAEGILGTTWVKDGVEQYGKEAVGYYGQISQALGDSFALAARYDWFDGDRDVEAAADSSDPEKPASANAIGTLGVGVIHYWDEVLKVTLAYEMPRTETPAGLSDPDDDLLTLQFQAKF